MANIVTRFIVPSFISLKKNQSVIALHITSDFFVRDIKEMQEKVPAWKVISPHEIIWSRKDCDVGWLFHHNQLERREGIYTGYWKETKKSIVAKGIRQAHFIVKKNKKNRIIGLKLLLNPTSDPKKPIICYVSLPKSEAIL